MAQSPGFNHWKAASSVSGSTVVARMLRMVSRAVAWRSFGARPCREILKPEGNLMYNWMHCFFCAGSIPIIGGQFDAAKPEVCWILRRVVGHLHWLLYISFLSFKPLCHISRLFHNYNHHLVQEPADIIQLHSSQDRLSLRKWRLMKLKYYNLPSCSWFVARDELRGVLFQHGSFFWAIITPGYRKIGMMYIILANLGSPLLAPLSLVGVFLM